MATAPRVRVLDVACFEQPFRLRLPFRFGVITVTHGLQAFVRVRVRLEDGREGDGYAAEALAAKWFDKNPALTDEENVDQLRRSIELHEPRLSRVRVNLDAPREMERHLRFRVDAVLKVHPHRPPVTFDATLQLSSNVYKVQG